MGFGTCSSVSGDSECFLTSREKAVSEPGFIIIIAQYKHKITVIDRNNTNIVLENLGSLL